MDEEILEAIEDVKEDDFQIPGFLEESSEDEIHERMLKELPEDIDVSEGGYIYDLTRPTAMEISRMKEYEMVEALKLIWPRFAEGIYLDYHAETRGLQRKETSNAEGILKIFGTAGTVIEEGTIFTTEGINGESAKEYETLEEAEISSEGMAEIQVQSVEAGTSGNCAANTVVLQKSFQEGIASVTNPSPISGGYEEENDESLRERIMEYDQSQGTSFVGNIGDYKRWAESIDEVGNVHVVSAQDDSGTVKIIISDAAGEPADQELIDKVRSYIMGEDDPQNRLAPLNAKVIVSTPTLFDVNITATVELEDITIEELQQEFQKEMKKYLKQTVEDGEIRYVKVGNILGNISGVYDYSELTVNGGTKNIIVPVTQMPKLKNAVLTAVTADSEETI